MTKEYPSYIDYRPLLEFDDEEIYTLLDEMREEITDIDVFNLVVMEYAKRN